MPRKPRVPRRKEPDVPAAFRPGFLNSLDGRTEVARLLKSRYDAIVSDLGGEQSLSTIQLSLVERYLWLGNFLEALEAEIAKTTDIKLVLEMGGKWTQACNAFAGLGTKLGLHRAANVKTIQGYGELYKDNGDDNE